MVSTTGRWRGEKIAGLGGDAILDMEDGTCPRQDVSGNTRVDLSCAQIFSHTSCEPLLSGYFLPRTSITLW